MVPVTALWLPILVATAIVFFASFIVHMVLPFHRTDLKRVPEEDGVMDALRRFNIPPGDYSIPCPRSHNDMKNPEFLAKVERGPRAFVTFLAPGRYQMGKYLALWVVYCLVVTIFAAYLAGAALPPGADYLEVFRFAGTTAFAGYALGQWPQSIWYSRSWVTTLKGNIDGLLYALLTAGTLGWLWPKGIA